MKRESPRILSGEGREGARRRVSAINTKASAGSPLRPLPQCYAISVALVAHVRLLVHAFHAVVVTTSTAAGFLLLFRQLGDHDLGREQQARDARGVL